MTEAWSWHRLNLAALAVFALGVLGCIIGSTLDPAGFYRAWLCAFLFWLGVPLGAVTLVLVHDLSGGRWMGTARPALDAAIAMMPLATLAGIPAFVGLHDLYSWAHPARTLASRFYLNIDTFLLRYAVYVVLWNLLAAYALWAPRIGANPVAASLSWISGVGLVVLAFSASFAAIDWIMSLEPTFWSSVFMMAAGAGWFNTGLALVLLVVALSGGDREHMADLAAILLATTIFWAYVEFCQFLIIWEENLKLEIPWYLLRMAGRWRIAVFVAAAFGFFVPFFVLLWTPGKRRPLAVASVCVLVLGSRLAESWWLVLPEFRRTSPFWLDVAAILALGGLVTLLFLWWLRTGGAAAPTVLRSVKAHHD
ncbi:MAG TPA: hypothetical protein VGF34_07115 [Stellaceae bacterium]|jgi:hypothetical protein